MKPLMRSIAAATLATAVALGGSLSASFAQERERCFAETDYCISGCGLEFWEQNGSLPVFGYPTGFQQEVVAEGMA